MGGRQRLKLGIYVGGIGDGVGNLLAKELPVPLPQPVNGHLERALRRFHLTRQRRVRHLGLPEQARLQPLEMLRTTVLRELVAQPLDQRSG